MLGDQKVEAFHNVAASGADCLIMFCARFGADHYGHVMDQGNVKSRGEANGLRKNRRRASIGHSMQSFAPPVVCWNLQARNGSRLVHKLRCFFFQRHTRNEVVDSLGNGQAGIEVGCSRGCFPILPRQRERWKNSVQRMNPSIQR